jgi:hypothetical protein
MNIKHLKLLDEFATPPSFLISRGSKNRGNVHFYDFGSWVGFFLTILITALSMLYLGYLINDMMSYTNDIFKTFVQTNNFKPGKE